MICYFSISSLSFPTLPFFPFTHLVSSIPLFFLSYVSLFSLSLLSFPLPFSLSSSSLLPSICSLLFPAFPFPFSSSSCSFFTAPLCDWGSYHTWSWGSHTGYWFSLRISHSLIVVLAQVLTNGYALFGCGI